jgi:hypothetical protein
MNETIESPWLGQVRLYICFAAVVLCALSLSTVESQAQDLGTAPGSVEQNQVLDKMRQYADGYVSGLPNFVCMQQNTQLEAGKKSNRWKKGDVLTSRLTFNQGQEHRKLELVNGRQLHEVKRRWRTPLVTEGEFGVLLSRVLGPDTEAVFAWNRWDSFRGRRVAVFDYNIDKEHSTLSLRLSDLAKATIPYHGSVYAEPGTGAVWRITDTATEIPRSLQTEEISTEIDFDQIAIGGATYLLPAEAVVSVLLPRSKVRNELTFRDYRKFEAQSDIKFGGEIDAQPPPRNQPH